jgi:hypothetical protein
MIDKSNPGLSEPPQCEMSGRDVRVTVRLSASEDITGAPFVTWHLGRKTARARVDGSTAVCTLPRGAFSSEDSFKLVVIPAPAPNHPVFPWTQIPLAEQFFQAKLLQGEPTLVPCEHAQVS